MQEIKCEQCNRQFVPSPVMIERSKFDDGTIDLVLHYLSCPKCGAVQIVLFEDKIASSMIRRIQAISANGQSALCRVLQQQLEAHCRKLEETYAGRFTFDPQLKEFNYTYRDSTD